MSFTLHVEFAGLCMYVRHEDGTRVAVLMPDARSGSNPKRKHLDELLNEKAEPHVGYVRLNAANLPERLPHPSKPADDPLYELIHRLDGEVLVFDDAFEPGPMITSLVVPEFDQFAPDLELLPDLFDNQPPPALLMRAILNGGTLRSALTPERWEIPPHLNPDQPPMMGQFASSVTWTREVKGGSTTLRITDFAGNTQRQFFLAPVEGESELHLKVANLCAHNPLEWDEMPLREVMGDDVDFKWLYRLYRPRDGKTYKEVLGGQALPIPKRIPMAALPFDTGSNDCIPAGTTGKF